MAPQFKVFDTEPEYRNPSPFLPQHPCRVSVHGPSGSGKTNWLLNALCVPKDQPFDYVEVFYGMAQPKYEILQKHLDKCKVPVTFHEGLPSGEEAAEFMAALKERAGEGKQGCIVFDDLMHTVEKSSWASKFFTAGVHHLNLSVYSLMQRVFASREQRLQSDYIVLYDFPADRSAVAALARQIMPMKPGLFMEMYRQATSKRFGWFMVDLRCRRDGSPQLEFRDNSFTRIFQPEKVRTALG